MKHQTKFRKMEIGKAISINPKRELKKGEISKKVSMDKINPFNKKINSFEIAKYKGGPKFINGDTLLARITPCLENGKTAYVDILDKDEIGFGSTEFIVLSEKEEKTTNEFVYYLAISPIFREFAISSMTGTSGRQRVQTDFLEIKEIEIPSISEQKAIAKILSDLDSKIGLNNKINKALDAIGQEIFNKYLIDDKKIGWKIKPLDEVADFLNGLALQKYPAGLGQEYLPVIKIKELKNGITIQTDKANLTIPKKYIINDGDVLFSWSGSLEILIWTGGKGALNQHLFKVSSKDYPKWFYYYWTKHFLKKFKYIAKEKATTMGHIKRNHLTESKVLIPDIGTFQKINNLISPLINKMINLNIESRILSKIRDSLLPRLISGKIRVK